jgi:GT2 family glycosyltransferase
MPESDLTSFAHASANSSSRRRRRTRLLRILWLWREKGARYTLKRALLQLGYVTRYNENWIRANDTLSQRDLTQIHARIKELQCRPVISLVLLIESPDPVALRRAVDSVCAQLYENWQLRIAGNSLKRPDIRALLDSYAEVDARIKVIADDVSGLIGAGNAGLAHATGDFIGFIGQGDQLAPQALYMIAEEINSHPEASLIYTDEDMIDDRCQRSSPQFKTDWNLDLFLSQNFFGHLTLYRRDLIDPAGFRAGFEGCEEYDLSLRAIEQAAPATIRHVPYVLVHRKALTANAAIEPVASVNARRAIQDHLDRLGTSATVEASRSGNYYRVRRMLPKSPPRVSIIIPIRDRVELLQGVIESILKKTDYPDYEIVVVDNQSSDPSTLSYLSYLIEHPHIRVLRFDHAYSHSAINNFAAKQCQSPVLAFLNNDLLVINGDWLTEMVSQAVRSEVGAVGAMLYYPDDVIQHAGILVGFGGVAVNCYSGLKRGSQGYFDRAELLQNYSAVTAACLLTRATVFAEAGGFNEADLPLTFNDVDYCLRLRERGYLVTWTPYAELYHLESVSRGDDMSPSKIDQFRKAQAYMAKRWANVLSSDPYYNPNLSLSEKPFEVSDRPRRSPPWRR